MIRPGRARSLAIPALVGVVLTGCGAVSSTDVAATVENTDISEDEYQQLLQTFVDHAELTGLQEDPDTGTVPGEDARRYLTLLILDVANEEFLAGAGEAITDADRQQLLQTINPDDPVFELPDDVIDVLVDQQAGIPARGRIAAATDLQTRYEASPAELGVMCVRHILVETEEAAQAVLDELDGGADFAELAAERSLDPNAAQTGGALGEGCVPIEDAETALDAEFMAGATGATPGSPTAPVQSSSGWHVILARPYDEVAESLAAIVGQTMFAEYLETADITVDPQLGRWDGASRAVVALQ